MNYLVTTSLTISPLDTALFRVLLSIRGLLGISDEESTRLRAPEDACLVILRVERPLWRLLMVCCLESCCLVVLSPLEEVLANGALVSCLCNGFWVYSL